MRDGHDPADEPAVVAAVAHGALFTDPTRTLGKRKHYSEARRPLTYEADPREPKKTAHFPINYDSQ